MTLPRWLWLFLVATAVAGAVTNVMQIRSGRKLREASEGLLTAHRSLLNDFEVQRKELRECKAHLEDGGTP